MSNKIHKLEQEIEALKKKEENDAKVAHFEAMCKDIGKAWVTHNINAYMTKESAFNWGGKIADRDLENAEMLEDCRQWLILLSKQKETTTQDGNN